MASKSQRAITDAKPEDWARLGRALQAWRENVLRYEHRADFARKTGINIRLVQDLEKNYRDTYTKWKLDEATRAYEIEPDPDPLKIAPSLLAVLHGEADTFVRAGGGAREQIRRPAPGLPTAPDPGLLREGGVRPYAIAIWDAAWRLALRGVADPSGAQIVAEVGAADPPVDPRYRPSPEDAKVWDGSRGAMGPADQAWLVGDIRRRREERRAEREPDASSA